MTKINGNSDNDNKVKQFYHLFLYSQNFFMTRRDDRLISIYFKILKFQALEAESIIDPWIIYVIFEY